MFVIVTLKISLQSTLCGDDGLKKRLFLLVRLYGVQTRLKYN